MKTGFLSLCILAAVIITAAPEPARAAGPFLNLPAYFGPVDTARVFVDAGQSFVEGESENSTALSFATGFRSGERTRVRLQMLYAAIRKDGYYDHGFADLLLDAQVMLAGDTMRINGLTLRGEMRIPTGSASIWPYAGESLDGGAGLEYRRLSDTIDIRIAASYILAGKRIKEGPFRNENYALAGILLGLKPFRHVTVDFSAFAQAFRNGDYREVYLLGARTGLPGGLDLRLSAGVDSGDPFERVWNSMIQVGITWKLPEAWKGHREPGPPSAAGPTEKTTP